MSDMNHQQSIAHIYKLLHSGWILTGQCNTWLWIQYMYSYT